MVSLSNHERLAQDVLVDKVRTSGTPIQLLARIQDRYAASAIDGSRHADGDASNATI
jgi:hypothetical protein